MTTTIRSVSIDAPVDQVFDTVAHVDRLAEAVPAITNIEYLSDSRRGAGARFEETRQIRGREGRTVLEITEYVEDEKVRIVSDAGGTIWDTLFTVAPGDHGGAELKMVMTARPHTLLARITTPLIKGVVSKGIEADLASVKEFCEGVEE